MIRPVETVEYVRPSHTGRVETVQYARPVSPHVVQPPRQNMNSTAPVETVQSPRPFSPQQYVVQPYRQNAAPVETVQYPRPVSPQQYVVQPYGQNAAPVETVQYPRPVSPQQYVVQPSRQNMNYTAPIETVQYPRTISPPGMQYGNTAPVQLPKRAFESAIQETVFPRGPVNHGYPGYQPIRQQPERPSMFIPLDRIHENGHPDIKRFTTEELSPFHDYLTKSTKDGRSVEGVAKMDAKDLESKQEKTLEGLKTQSFGTDLDSLLSLCELSNLRDKKCVDFFTEAGFHEIFTTAIIAAIRGDVYVNDQIDHPGYYVAFNLLVDAAQRLTEISPELCRLMGKEAVPLLLDFVRDHFFDIEALNRDDEELKWMSRRELLKKTFTILYNCIRNYPDNRGIFRRNMASSLLQPFLDCRFFILRAKALFILAYIVTEEENIDLNTTSINIEFIVKILRRALEDSSSHYSAHYNFFAVEVVEAVQRVAINDDNKDKFIEAGVLPHLTSMMDDKNSQEEQDGALNALWVLSFTKQCKDVILNEEGCIDNVRKLIGEADYTRTCQAILWNLQGEVVTTPDAKKESDQKSDEKAEESGQEPSTKETLPTESDQPQVKGDTLATKPPHVMISYQWDVQKQIIKVKDILKAHGFNVWLDLEQMGGSTLEAMANAVEEACVVIICFSEKYKDSSACRTEAEYTYKLRKPIVPLKMQTGYDPNGWLGAMLGTKFYIEMNTLERVEENMGLLVRELAGRGRYPVDSDDDGDDDVYIPAQRTLPPPSPAQRTLPPPTPPLPVAGRKIVRRQSYSPQTVIRSPNSIIVPRDPQDRYGRPAVQERIVEVPVQVPVEVPVYREKIIAVPATAPTVPKDSGTTCIQIVLQWKAEDVLNWLGRNNYTHLRNWFIDYTGEDLVGLKKIAAQAPEFFFARLERDFGFKSLLEMIRFKKMLDDII